MNFWWNASIGITGLSSDSIPLWSHLAWPVFWCRRPPQCCTIHLHWPSVWRVCRICCKNISGCRVVQKKNVMCKHSELLWKKHMDLRWVKADIRNPFRCLIRLKKNCRNRPGACLKNHSPQIAAYILQKAFFRHALVEKLKKRKKQAIYCGQKCIAVTPVFDWTQISILPLQVRTARNKGIFTGMAGVFKILQTEKEDCKDVWPEQGAYFCRE